MRDFDVGFHDAGAFGIGRAKVAQQELGKERTAAATDRKIAAGTAGGMGHLALAEGLQVRVTVPQRGQIAHVTEAVGMVAAPIDASVGAHPE